MDVHGKCAFDYVNDHKEWMDSGHFSEEVKAILKGELECTCVCAQSVMHGHVCVCCTL